MTTGILTAGGGHQWETDVVTALAAPTSHAAVVRRCADVADLLATAATGQASICVVAADLRRLDSDTVVQLAGYGIRVVAVYEPAKRTMRQRLHDIGIAAVVADDAGADAIVDAVNSLLDDGARNPEATDSATRWAAADPAWAWHSERTISPSVPVSADGNDPIEAGLSIGDASSRVPGYLAQPDTSRSARTRDEDALPATGETNGVVVAVWGPIGAPGRSTISMALADQLARDGKRVMLIDADVYGGVLASAFGLLDESPGLAGACRLAAAGELDLAQLIALGWSVGDRLTVLTGIARADRWPEIRASAIPAVLDLARRSADVVVVDCAALLESDEELSFDTMAPRRNGATLAIVEAADATVAVGAGDPPGMERLIRGLTELAAIADLAEVRIVINRVRKTAASRAELAAALRRFAHLETTAYVPDDRGGCDRAWQQGVVLSAAAPKSPILPAIATVAKSVPGVRLSSPANAPESVPR